MKQALAALAVLIVVGCGSSGKEAGGPPAYKDIVLTDDETAKAAKTEFAKDTARIFVVFGLSNVSIGTKIRSVWICDKSDVAPPNYKIDEATLPVVPPMNSGTFSISKPNAGWPVGTYHVDMYMDDKLAETVKFSVK